MDIIEIMPLHFRKWGPFISINWHKSNLYLVEFICNTFQCVYMRLYLPLEYTFKPYRTYIENRMKCIIQTLLQRLLGVAHRKLYLLKHIKIYTQRSEYIECTVLSLQCLHSWNVTSYCKTDNSPCSLLSIQTFHVIKMKSFYSNPFTLLNNKSVPHTAVGTRRQTSFNCRRYA